MQTPPSDYSRFLNALGAQLGTPLSSADGVCALYDSDGKEAAVIEMPEHSEIVMFHCAVGRRPEQADALHRLLTLNFDVALLRGCWLAVSENDVRLCTHREFSSLSEAEFCNVALGFIAQAQEVREWVGTPPMNTAPPVAARSSFSV